MNSKEILKAEIMRKVKEYYELECAPTGGFVPGTSRIPYAGRIYDEKEMQNLVASALEFWLTAGHFTEQFERGLADFINVRYCSSVNSGSSANLLAFMALTADELCERKINRGDEVITVAAGFPTTVAPIIQYGAIPVFVDVELGTYNLDVDLLEPALSERTKAVMLAHTLGNPFDIKTVNEFCSKHGLWLIEDNCDALGSRYDGQYTGTFGDLATSSFYPAHHITTGEGGAVYTNNPQLYRIVNSLRDWGRDCICPSGKDNTCGHRFDRQYGELPFGYDHKYVYSHFGYNLKMTDMQAAIGCAQLEKLPDFIAARKTNWELLREGLNSLAECLILPEPTANSDPSWFGFPVTLRTEAKFHRNELVNHLESLGIQTRMLFAGNITKHPCFEEIRNDKWTFRVSGNLGNTDRIMNDTFWVGVYPGMTGEMRNYVIASIRSFLLGV
ncbi:MAG: lipopolysaccharide biosynthesis protein RfbH [Syntrophomonadaceae bacterium]|nr:lipopolysaccharide biosynthesis protein RfbH [Syntrophomonadaceae bacterium]